MEEKVEENTGEELTGVAEPEQEEIPITPTGEEKTTSTGAYKKLDLTVTPVVKNVPDIPHVAEDEEKEVKTTFTKEDSEFFASMIWGVPPAIMGDYIAVDEKLIKEWGKQLFSYCERKGINIYDYVFAELGLVMSTGVIVTSMAVKYREHKKELEEAKEKENGT